MSRDIIDFPSGVFLGPENQPNHVIQRSFASGYGISVQEGVRSILFQKEKVYTLPPHLRESKFNHLVSALLDKVSLFGLELGIQTTKDREMVLENLIQSQKIETDIQ